MAKTIKGLQITTKDNLATALAKGMVEGVVHYSVGCLGIAAVCYVGGKLAQSNDKVKSKD